MLTSYAQFDIAYFSVNYEGHNFVIIFDVFAYDLYIIIVHGVS